MGLGDVLLVDGGAGTLGEPVSPRCEGAGQSGPWLQWALPRW